MHSGLFYWKKYKEISTHKIGLDLDYGIEVIGGRVYLCLDGSNSFSDWVYDFMFPRKVYKNQTAHMVVHRGFAKVWKSGNDQIITELVEACRLNNESHPVIVGHSMGGALALFAAEDLFFRSGIKAEVYTFGAPKVCGDKKTAEYIKSCCHLIKEYEHKNDVVCLCPPLPWFYHVSPVKIGVFSFKDIFRFNYNHHRYDVEEDYNGL